MKVPEGVRLVAPIFGKAWSVEPSMGGGGVCWIIVAVVLVVPWDVMREREVWRAEGRGGGGGCC